MGGVGCGGDALLGGVGSAGWRTWQTVTTLTAASSHSVKEGHTVIRIPAKAIQSATIDSSPFSIVEEQFCFYEQYATALTQWASLELQLGQMVASVSGDGQSTALFNAFFGVEDFRSKLEFADRYVQVLGQTRKELVSHWSVTKKQLQPLSETRNKLAHWQATVYSDGVLGRRQVLVPPSLKLSKRKASDDELRAKGQPLHAAIGILDLAKFRSKTLIAMLRIGALRYLGEGVNSDYNTMDAMSRQVDEPFLDQIIIDFRAMRQMR